ncbi:MAG: TetR family transcriptional regulator [Acidobacteriota bacterium]
MITGEFPVHREPTDTERKVLDAALEVFARKGLHGASTQEIGDAAGVGKSTLHYYFRHKDELYQQVFERAFLRMAAPLAERLRPGQTLRETLDAIVAYQVQAYFERPEMVRLWMHENLIGAPAAIPLLRRFNATTSPYRQFVDNLRAAIARGEARPVDPLQTFVTVMGASLFLPIAQASMTATLPALDDPPRTGPIDMEAFVAERAEQLVELLDRGLRADPA